MRTGRRLLLAQMRKQWRALAVGTALGLVWTAAKVVVPLLVSGAVDDGIEGDDTGSLVWWALLIAALGAVAGVASASRRYLGLTLS